MEELQEDYTLVIPDMIFFGESYSEYSEFSPHFQASQIQKCLASLGYDRYFVAGLSYGGLVASILAQNHPENVKGLILIDALTKFFSRDYSDSLALTFGESSAEKLLLPEDGKGMKKLMKASYYKAPPIPAFLYNKPAKTLYYKHRMQKEGMVFYLSDNEKKLQTGNYQFGGPVCIIWGREDLLTPLRVAYELEEYYPNSEVPTILEKTGHTSHLESPEELAKRIREFVIRYGDS